MLGDPNIVYYGMILHSFSYLANRHGCCPPDPSYLPQYSPPRSDLTTLILLLSLFLTSALKALTHPMIKTSL